MNYNAMSDTELLDHLDMYSNDPLIRRVAGVLERTRGALLDDLEHAGMNPLTWEFGDGWQAMYPGAYIIDLRANLERAEEEAQELRYQLEQVSDEHDRLKTRTIMEFIEEVQKEKRENQELVREAMATVKAFKDENQRLKEQIDMWGRMNQVRGSV